MWKPRGLWDEAAAGEDSSNGLTSSFLHSKGVPSSTAQPRCNGVAHVLKHCHHVDANQDIRPTPRHIGGCLPHTPCDHPSDSCTHHVPCSMRDNSPNNKIVRIYIFTYIYIYILTYTHTYISIISLYIHTLNMPYMLFNLLNMLLKYWQTPWCFKTLKVGSLSRPLLAWWKIYFDKCAGIKIGMFIPWSVIWIPCKLQAQSFKISCESGQESLSSHHKIHRRWSNPYRRAKEELLWIEQKCWISYPSSPQRCYLAILHTGWHSCPSRHSCHYVWLKGQEALVMKPQAAFNNQLANRANGKPQFSTSSLLQQYFFHAREEIKNSFLQPVKVSVGVCCSGGLYPT